VTGLAALIIAHHPDFQGAVRMHTGQRVERLFQIIKAACRPVMVGDQRRTGFGLPDAPRALGLIPAQMPVSQISSLGRQALENAYREMPQTLPQNASLGMNTYDPYANLLAIQQAMAMQNNMPNAFAYRMW